MGELLRELTSVKSEWSRNSTFQDLYDNAKRLITKDPYMKFYYASKPLCMDSAVGLSTVWCRCQRTWTVGRSAWPGAGSPDDNHKVWTAEKNCFRCPTELYIRNLQRILQKAKLPTIQCTIKKVLIITKILIWPYYRYGHHQWEQGFTVQSYCCSTDPYSTFCCKSGEPL